MVSRRGGLKRPKARSRIFGAACTRAGLPTSSKIISTNWRVVTVSGLDRCHARPRASSRSPIDNQPSADVGYVGVGVGLVGVPGHLGALAFHGPTKDLLSGSRGEYARPEEVRCSPDGYPHPAAFVGPHQLLGHLGADRTFAGVGCVGQILGEDRKS